MRNIFLEFKKKKGGIYMFDWLYPTNSLGLWWMWWWK